MRVQLHHNTSDPHQEWHVKPAVLKRSDPTQPPVIYLDVAEDPEHPTCGTTLYFRDIADAQAFEDKVRSAVRAMADACGKGERPTRNSGKGARHAATV